MSGVQEQTVLPPKDVEVLTQIEGVLGSKAEVVQLTGAGIEAALPPELRSIITKVVVALRRGQAITIAPHALRLTTQQAADLLGISRPTLVKLLEDGQIPYETPNRHRRIQLADLLKYQESRRTERRRTLRTLTREGQDTGLYDSPVDEYESALAEARSKFA